MSDFLKLQAAGIVGWAIGVVVALIIVTLLPFGILFGMVVGGGVSLTGYTIASLIYIDRRFSS